MTLRTVKILLWLAAIVGPAAWVWADIPACPNNLPSDPGCPTAGVCGQPSEPGCSLAAFQWNCWQLISTSSGSSDQCQFHFSCHFEACEHFTWTSEYWQKKGCSDQIVRDSRTCYHITDTDTGYDCCP